jgi:hypothetical protein
MMGNEPIDILEIARERYRCALAMREAGWAVRMNEIGDAFLDLAKASALSVSLQACWPSYIQVSVEKIVERKLRRSEGQLPSGCYMYPKAS